MIQVQTELFVADNTGAKKMQKMKSRHLRGSNSRPSALSAYIDIYEAGARG